MSPLMAEDVRRALRFFLDGLLDLVLPLPAGCPLCGSLGDLGGEAGPDAVAPRVGTVCGRCADRYLLRPGEGCRSCPKPQAGPSGLCPDCWRYRPPFARAVAAGVYAGDLRRAVLRFKHGGERWLAGPLGALASVALRAGCHPPDVVVPVPLTAAARRRRGFNQAELLARRAAAPWGLPVEPRLLDRARGSRPTVQARLGLRQRWENAAGAFVAPAPAAVRGASVLVVDDVYTTGATAAACAEALLAAGARRVEVCVVAVGLLARPSES